MGDLSPFIIEEDKIPRFCRINKIDVDPGFSLLPAVPGNGNAMYLVNKLGQSGTVYT
jgi:hypothetical protein